MKVTMIYLLLCLIVFLFSCNSSSESSNPPDNSIGFGVPLDSLDLLSERCVNRINEYRATEGLAPLERWEKAENCTHQSAKNDSETLEAHGSFGDCGERAQNECPGWNSLEATIESCLKSMWDEKNLGPDVPYSQNGHYLNMSNSKYSNVACGFYQTPTGKVWAIQNFK